MNRNKRHAFKKQKERREAQAAHDAAVLVAYALGGWTAAMRLVKAANLSARCPVCLGWGWYRRDSPIATVVGCVSCSHGDHRLHPESWPMAEPIDEANEANEANETNGP